MPERVAVVLFTRDLRLDDLPALTEASRLADRIAPLFVLDPVLLAGSERRRRYLFRCLHALDADLRARGGRLVIRHGDPASEVARLVAQVGASVVLSSADVSAYARRREQRLRDALPRLDVRALPGSFVTPPGALHPQGTDHYRVFTPYWRAWEAATWRTACAAPRRIQLPDDLQPGHLPELRPVALDAGPPAGEQAAWMQVERWIGSGGLDHYGSARDQLAAEGTSRLSPLLRFGCLSPLQLARRVGPGEFRRQLAWRDFYAQLLWANPRWQWADARPLPYAWDDDRDALSAWREGRTGYPLVDAAMHQLEREGFMHNRARMLVASFLTKHLNLDWRHGAAHFHRLLLDGDPASNTGSWQTAADTGVGARPGRLLSPARHALRFDADGRYVQRYLPAPAADDRYPDPIVDPAHAMRRYRDRLAAGVARRKAVGT